MPLTKVTKSLIQTEAGDANKVLTSDGSTLSWAYATSLFIAKDEKPNGTNGGSNIAGTQTRTLNTVSFNSIQGASLASNQITLPSGTYLVRAVVPAFGTGATKANFYNVTDSAIAINGTSVDGSSSTNGDRVTTYNHVIGVITISSTKVFEIKHYTADVYAGGGLGAAAGPSGTGIETYTVIEIQKIA